ncbi:hypothetical protein OCK05_004389 [Salmonella enterica subsp. enterica serovar Kentucky]|nr:hypothetical protein [Salmonella enterica subsp. enterica serovar Kentucky]
MDNRKRLPTVERLCPQPGGRNKSFYKFFELKKEKARKAATSRASGFPINAGVVRKVAVPEL